MKLRYNTLLCLSVEEFKALAGFIESPGYRDAVSIQIDFRDNEIEMFDENGHTVCGIGFDELLET